MLDGKPFSCTLERLLHFFRNKEDAMLFAEVIQLFHKNLMPHNQPCIALYWLYDDSRNLFRRKVR
jgi:hypothetical protein